MQTKYQMILDEYHQRLDSFKALEKIVDSTLTDIVKSSDLHIYTIAHRIKEENSLAGKLKRKGDKYSSLSDITDILGARIVCYFFDEVDKLTQLISSRFSVDEEKSIDKRKMLDFNMFGYLSVHYICTLRSDADCPEELKNIRFEIQMCSLMQHIWAVLEHDLGYKTRYGVPSTVKREFSRLAGLFEIADEHVVQIRDKVNAYTNLVKTKILNGDSSDILLDSVSLDEFMCNNKNILSFLAVIGNICGADIVHEKSDNYLRQLAWLKIRTLGDLQSMLERNYSFALQLVEKRLAMAELDIFSSTIALRFLCQAQLILGDYKKEEIVEFFMLSMRSRELAEKRADFILSLRE